MRKLSSVILLIFVLTSIAVSNYAQEDGSTESEVTCPDKCVRSQKNCELSCSQIVGGGAKSRERRECMKGCSDDLEPCNERCLNPTPRPTLKPERYHDKTCSGACDFKAKDCYQVCTKYTGGGAKSGEKSKCQDECTQSKENCKNWCINPTPKPTLGPDPLESMPCPDVCNIKKLDCEANCSSFIGGGAKSGKRAECNNDCKEDFDQCSDSCTQ